eukprot:TRINITY_DN18102_c2_g1_i1.p1 TRINITY_DN18102_c2_g1~~TRINITY_DN18102_c2_g1_i1.p1  ORF type:complete len:125 (-),score=11.37 TRINITY_DN18102_c2_g1_i1:249-623(-)
MGIQQNDKGNIILIFSYFNRGRSSLVREALFIFKDDFLELSQLKRIQKLFSPGMVSWAPRVGGWDLFLTRLNHFAKKLLFFLFMYAEKQMPFQISKLRCLFLLTFQWCPLWIVVSFSFLLVSLL